MASDDYFSEGEYRCNHPESDFENDSGGPIEMKKERGFVEYTHRNENSNQRYDVWTGSANYNRYQNNVNSNYNRYQSSAYTNSLYSGTNYNTQRYNKPKKNGDLIVAFVVIFLFFGLPMLLSFIGAIAEALDF